MSATSLSARRSWHPEPVFSAGAVPGGTVTRRNHSVTQLVDRMAQNQPIIGQP
jgi:hypothetical protein